MIVDSTQHQGTALAVRRPLPQPWVPTLAVALMLCCVAAGVGEHLREAETAAAAHLAAVGGLAVVALGVGVRSGIPGSCAWFAAALLGSQATLLMIHAGRELHYQHLPPISRLATETDAWILALLGIQCCACGYGMIRWFASGAYRFEFRHLAILLGMVLVSATLSRNISDYVGELVIAGFLQALHLATLLLAAVHLPGEWDLGRLWWGVARRWWFVGACAAWVFSVSVALVWTSYDRHPHIADEVVYLVHARYLAAGKLTLPLLPVPAAFEMDLVTYKENHWYSPCPVGWPLVLAAGSLLGCESLVNPLLAAVVVVLTYYAVREVYSRRTALLAVSLLSVSPWFIFMAMSYMVHISATVFALGAFLGAAKMRRGKGIHWGVLGGCCLGMVGLIRPLDGALIAPLLGLWILIGRPGSRWQIVRAGTYTAATILVGAAGLWYNRQLTGDPLLFPVSEYCNLYFAPGSNALGFGPNRGAGWGGLDPYHGHSPFEALINTNLNAFALNIELFGWSTGSLLVIAAYLCYGMKGRDWLLAGLVLWVIAAYSLYWFSGGPDFGPRYWFFTLIPLVVLTVRGIARFRAMGRSSASATACVVGAAAAISLATFIPWRAIDKYSGYRGMQGRQLRQLAASPAYRNGMVLVRGEEFPDYMSAAVYNQWQSPDSEQLMFARYRDPETVREVARHFADRRFWVLDGPTRTGSDYRMVAGPLTADELLDFPRQPATGDRHVSRKVK